MNRAVDTSTASGRSWTARIAFWLGKAYRGGGRPASKEVLDRQYRVGGWQRLDTLQQMVPCMLVANYVQHLSIAEPRVLDVGCGHGRLARLLSRFPMGGYVGIDLSSEAIRQAQEAGIDNAQFVAADFDHWTPSGRFDVVVFLDSLYYAVDPLATLQRYSRYLAPEGHLVVSMLRYSNNGLILRKLARHFEKVDETSARSGPKRWDVQVFRPAARHAHGARAAAVKGG